MCVCVHDYNMWTTSAAMGGKQILMGHLQSAPSSPARERHLLSCCLQLRLRSRTPWYQWGFLSRSSINCLHAIRGLQKAVSHKPLNKYSEGTLRCMSWWKAPEKDEAKSSSLRSLGSGRGGWNPLPPGEWSPPFPPSPHLPICSGGRSPVEPKKGEKEDWSGGSREEKEKKKGERHSSWDIIFNVLRAHYSSSRLPSGSDSRGSVWV